MRRYEDAVEVDLRQRYGEDLGHLWRSRRWAYLANLVERLPYNSHLRQEQLNDPDYVGQVLEAQAGAEPAKGTPVSEFSAEVRTLESVGFDIRGLGAVIQSALGASGRPKPYDGPSTVVEKAQIARRRQKHQKVLGLVEEARRKARDG